METLKTYFGKNSEQVFALTLLLTIIGINYFVPYKLVFLNFYFLVVLLGTYYLEPRKGVLGGVLAALLVSIHVYYYPGFYFTLSSMNLESWMTVLVWCSFLILTGAVMGSPKINLQIELQQLKEANLVLQGRLQRAGAGQGHTERAKNWLEAEEAGVAVKHDPADVVGGPRPNRDQRVTREGWGEGVTQFLTQFGRHT